MEHLHKRDLDVAAPGASLEHLRAQRNEHGEFPVDLPPPYFLAHTHPEQPPTTTGSNNLTSRLVTFA